MALAKTTNDLRFPKFVILNSAEFFIMTTFSRLFTKMTAIILIHFTGPSAMQLCYSPHHKVKSISTSFESGLAL